MHGGAVPTNDRRGAAANPTWRLCPVNRCCARQLWVWQWVPTGAAAHIPSNAQHSPHAAAPRPCCRDAWHCIPIRSILFILSKKPLNPWLRTARFEFLRAGTARQGRGRDGVREFMAVQCAKAPRLRAGEGDGPSPCWRGQPARAGGGRG
jgi:hypothetical protein